MLLLHRKKNSCMIHHKCSNDILHHHLLRLTEAMRIFNMKKKQLKRLLHGTDAGKTTMKIIYWLLGIAAVAFFIMKVMNMNRMNLFKATSQSNTAYTIEDENIYAISFDTAIQQALQEGNYRLAIRLLYLQNLKILADKNFIVWQPNK